MMSTRFEAAFPGEPTRRPTAPSRPALESARGGEDETARILRWGSAMSSWIRTELHVDPVSGKATVRFVGPSREEE